MNSNGMIIQPGNIPSAPAPTPISTP
jgi:hypothetical protein